MQVVLRHYTASKTCQNSANISEKVLTLIIIIIIIIIIIRKILLERISTLTMYY